jgi:hypothetical protein
MNVFAGRVSAPDAAGITFATDASGIRSSSDASGVASGALYGARPRLAWPMLWFDKRSISIRS